MRTRWTDLAMESRGAQPEQTQTLPGGIERTVITIRDEQTAQALGRPVGVYVTLSCPQRMSIELGTVSYTHLRAHET